MQTTLSETGQQEYCVALEMEGAELPLPSVVKGLALTMVFLSSWNDPSVCRSAEPALLPSIFGTGQPGLSIGSTRIRR